MREKDILGETDIGRHKRRLVPMPCHSKFHHQSCSPTLRNGIYLRNQKKTQNETVLKKQVKYNYKYNMNKVNMNTILTKTSAFSKPENRTYCRLFFYIFEMVILQ